jgi:hypothetical protein
MLIVYLVAVANFQIGSGDTSENGKRVLDSRFANLRFSVDFQFLFSYS